MIVIRAVVSALVRLIGRLRVPMGLRMMRVLARGLPDGSVDLHLRALDQVLVIREPVTTMSGIALAFGHALEPELLSLSAAIVDQEGVLIDVGANIGTYCLPLARRARRVFAIDANPEIVCRLRVNAALNGVGNVTAICAAIAEKPGFRTFYVSEGRHDVSSFKRQWLDTWAQAAGAEERVVPALPLEELLVVADAQSIALLKIDVEDYSGAAITGIGGAIARINAILAEDSSDLAPVIPWLTAQGFAAEQPLKGRKGVPQHTATTWLFRRK